MRPRKSLVAFLPILAIATSLGCAAPDSDSNDETLDELRGATTVSVYLRIAESKVVFSSKVESFGVKDGASLDLPCETRSFYLNSKPSLYAGWSPESAAAFSEDVAGSKFREYQTASCRNADTHVFGWFAKERELEFTVPEQLLNEKYKPAKLPLMLQIAPLGSGAPTYYACNGAFKKTLIGETDNAKRFDIEASCKRRSAPTDGELGPIDFINAPGPYAALASYKPWMLPPVASTKANFERIRNALLAKVAEGKYSGAMSTLSKRCDLEVNATADGLSIDHTIQSSQRTRHLELKADNLLGFVEGDLYPDPIRVSGTPQGKFAAAEFRDSKGESVVVRFEENNTLDGLVVRIDGSETYCRRLAKE
jgi:hypothetical protein